MGKRISMMAFQMLIHLNQRMGEQRFSGFIGTSTTYLDFSFPDCISFQSQLTYKNDMSLFMSAAIN
jgi:hypothetical protein